MRFRLALACAVLLLLTACSAPGSSTGPTTTPAASTSSSSTTTPSTTTTTEAARLPDPGISVVLVEAGQTLEVRAEPDSEAQVVGSLTHDATGVSVTGETQGTNTGIWVELAEPSGWVNGYFLTGPRPDEAAMRQAIAQLVLAFDTGADLRPVVDDRGIFVLTHDEIHRIAGLDLAVVLNSEDDFDWGGPPCADCPAVGTFAASIAGPFSATWTSDETVTLYGALPADSDLEVPGSFENFPYASVTTPDGASWLVFVEGDTGRVVGLLAPGE